MNYNELQDAMIDVEKSVKPFIDIIVEIRQLAIPKYELTQNGVIKVTHDGLSEQERETIKYCEDAIAMIHRRAKLINPPSLPAWNLY